MKQQLINFVLWVLIVLLLLALFTFFQNPDGPRVVQPTAAMLDDPAYWRGRADASRVLFERLADVESKRHMLEIAERYEYLAQRAEERRRRSGN